MNILVTGCHGYIGSVLVPMLLDAGHRVVGIDSHWFEPCTFGPPSRDVPCIANDIRDVEASDLEGLDAVIHLAALSNDPLGDLDPELTYEINHRATVRLARLAKQAGITRFLVSSSCSTYGASGDNMLREDASFNPVTPYGESKVLADRDVSLLADDNFSPTFLRNATAYGISPRLRLDLVLNEFVAAACTKGSFLIKSDGTPWRPLIHVEDIGRAFIAILGAPRDVVHNEAFNVGQTTENYRVRELADIVCETVPGSRAEYAGGGGPDPRCYRIDCTKINQLVPGFQPQWTIRLGARQIYEAYQAAGLTIAEMEGPRYYRLSRLRQLISSGQLDAELRWQAAGADAAAIFETGSLTADLGEVTK
ncbi:MAG: SDR family oxidoreductase [Planctomycetia bacterium]|nr:SDR family oxidoreductase [Planctomycetia bacterium]